MLTLLCCAAARAEWKWFDRALDKIYGKPSYDTLFIGKPEERWTVKVRTNISGTSIGTGGIYDGERFHSELYSRHRATVSGAFDYRGLGLTLSVNPGKLLGRNSDNEFNFVLYNNRWGAELFYHNTKSFSGRMFFQGNNTDIPRNRVQQHLFTYNGYYAFNHRRFSYPAAITQGQWQLRSAGSVLLGTTVMFDRTLNETETPYTSNTWQWGVGAGYGYNFALGAVTRFRSSKLTLRRLRNPRAALPHSWLLHISTIPQFVVIGHYDVQLSGGLHEKRWGYPNFILNTRAAAVRDWGRHFISAVLILNNNLAI
ncbi:MAG: DUF4421 family protein, partial [Bacteroidaceae bacterium]|nr:DUF4421 family protein [Bacteroidaceae bacterium]